MVGASDERVDVIMKWEYWDDLSMVEWCCIDILIDISILCISVTEYRRMDNEMTIEWYKFVVSVKLMFIFQNGSGWMMLEKNWWCYDWRVMKNEMAGASDGGVNVMTELEYWCWLVRYLRTRAHNQITDSLLFSYFHLTLEY